MKTFTAYCKINFMHEVDYKKLISYSLSLPFDNQIYPFVQRSNSSVHKMNWYTLQCSFDSS